MSAAEQIFYFSQRLHTCVRAEKKRSETSNVHEPVVAKIEMKSLFSHSYSSSEFKGSYEKRNVAEKPSVMEIGSAGYPKDKKFSSAKKRSCIESKLRFICGEPNGTARNNLERPNTAIGNT